MEIKKSHGSYNRLIIACLEDETVFSFIPADFVSQEGKDTATIFGINPTKRLLEVIRKMPNPILMDNEDKIIRLFARVEEGVPQHRLNAIIAALNKEIESDSVPGDRLRCYEVMVDNWFEKVMATFEYNWALLTEALVVMIFAARRS